MEKERFGCRSAEELLKHREVLGAALDRSRRERDRRLLGLFSRQRELLDQMPREYFPVLASGELADQFLGYIMEGDTSGEMRHRARRAVGILPVCITKSRFYSILEKSLAAYVGKPRFLLEEMIRAAASRAGIGEEAEAPEGISGSEKPVSAESVGGSEKPASSESGGGSEKPVSSESVGGSEKSASAESVGGSEKSASPESVGGLEWDIPAEMGTAIASGETGQTPESIQAEKWRLIRETRRLERLLLQTDACLASLLTEENAASEKAMSSLLPVLLEELRGGYPLLSLRQPASALELLTREELDVRVQEFSRELEQRLKKASRRSGQAVMARVLSGLPVWFKTLEEAESYIYDSLSLCSDPSERELCRLDLEQMMVEKDALV